MPTSASSILHKSRHCSVKPFYKPELKRTKSHEKPVFLASSALASLVKPFWMSHAKESFSLLLQSKGLNQQVPNYRSGLQSTISKLKKTVPSHIRLFDWLIRIVAGSWRCTAGSFVWEKNTVPAENLRSFTTSHSQTNRLILHPSLNTRYQLLGEIIL